MADIGVENKRKKIIIDTDPGIDDAMAILLALQSPEVDVIGLTTIYGNVRTTLATTNALHLEVPKLRTAAFAHGSDGLGETNIDPPKGKQIAQSASGFLVEKANKFPGEVTVVALGPLTNIALAIKSNPDFPQKIRQIIILGGAFSVNGNVNPATEANIFGDPEAADIVFTCGADIIAIGINITHQVVLTDKDVEDLASSSGKYAKYICNILKFYFDYHHEAYNICGAYLHDPTVMFAAIDPSLMTYAEGVVRVQADGIFRGLTLFDNMKKRWGEVTEWSNKPRVKVAVSVDGDKIVHLLKERLKNS